MHRVMSVGVCVEPGDRKSQLQLEMSLDYLRTRK